MPYAAALEAAAIPTTQDVIKTVKRSLNISWYSQILAVHNVITSAINIVQKRRNLEIALVC
jgi:hypothetical protein